MASIKVKLRLSTVPGKSGTVFYQVSHRKEVKQITTQIHLQPVEWDAAGGRVCSNAVIGMARLSAVQRQIDHDTDLLQQIIHSFEMSGEDFSLQSVIDRYLSFQGSVYVLKYIEDYIAALTSKGKRGTAKNLRCTLNSFSEYLGGKDIPFFELNEPLLLDYEEWLQCKGIRRNSSSFYMRNLRSVYNKAVRQGYVRQTDPFRNIYTGIDKTSKRAVDESVIAELKALELSGTDKLALARDLFIFSYCTRGMSFIDMAYLKRANIVNGTIRYNRRKTGQPLAVRIEPSVQKIISRYREMAYADYIFPVIRSDDETEAYRQYQSRLRYYNKQLKKLSGILGGDVSLTSYVSRHSWASSAHKHHVPLSIISDSMGHHSEKTTQIYLASMDEDVINRTNAKIVASLENKKKVHKKSVSM